MERMSNRGASARNLVSLAWSFAALGNEHVGLFSAVSSEATSRPSELGPRDIAQLAWAFAKLSRADLPLFSKLAVELQREEGGPNKLHRCNRQDLALLAWLRCGGNPLTVAREEMRDDENRQEHEPVGVEDDERLSMQRTVDVLLQEASEKALGRLHEFKPQELSSLVWAVATLQAVPSCELLHCAAQEAVDRTCELLPQHLSNLAWAFASLGQAGFGLGGVCSAATASWDETNFWKAIASASSTKLHEFTAQGLANLAWAFACQGMGLSQEQENGAICLSTKLLAEAIAAESLAKLPDFTTRGLANLSWSLAALSANSPELLRAASLQLGRDLLSRQAVNYRGEGRSLEALVLDTNEIIWAQAFVGSLDQGLLGLARQALPKALKNDSSRRDHASVCPLPLGDPVPRRFPSPGDKVEEPEVVLDLPDRLVLRKPPGWEVDDQLGKLEGDDSAHKLTRFWQSLLPPRQWPLVNKRHLQCGFLHRLDVPSSGLVLCAKDRGALLDLNLQLASGELVRDYVVLCRGWCTPRRLEISARVA
ncbi:unnamed protein product, partial [Polarella glacialis]